MEWKTVAPFFVLMVLATALGILSRFSKRHTARAVAEVARTKYQSVLTVYFTDCRTLLLTRPPVEVKPDPLKDFFDFSVWLTDPSRSYILLQADDGSATYVFRQGISRAEFSVRSVLK